MKKISCIISAFNEGPRIENVIRIVSNHHLIDKVIVVDDGSSDDTEQKAREFQNIEVIRHKKNKGKSCSMLDGCNSTHNDLVLFLDGDLTNINKNNINRLVKPLLNDSVDMTIALVTHDTRYNKIINLVGNGAYSGQRAMKKDIALKNLGKAKGYAAEAILNQYVLNNKLRFILVDWNNVKATSRVKEMDLIQRHRSYIKTFKEIFNVLGIFGFFIHLLRMRKNAVRED
ncbi:MAG: glycosyltransferase [Candidatus Lokiarchaeota archaeon]